jgi:hypothetical protein
MHVIAVTASADLDILVTPEVLNSAKCKTNH